jgi:hypothetical protein
MRINSDQLTTEGELEVCVAYHRGFAINEFIWVIRAFQPNPDYCPDPDNFCTGTPGHWALVTHRLYRAIRIKNGEETWNLRGYSVEQIKEQINYNLGQVRDPIPF